MAKLSDLQNFYNKHKPGKKENPHAGHRNRLKERFVKEGNLSNFELHNILELLLFFGIPQKDTNPLAHELIRTFGGFDNVFEAPLRQLASVKGMTRNAAVLIKLIPEIYRRYLDEATVSEERLNSPEKLRNYLLPKFEGLSEEIVYLLCMDSTCKLLKVEIVGKGSEMASFIDIRKIVEITLQCNAKMIVLAHNHPDGTKSPSTRDKETTRRLEEILSALSIEFIDHFIIAGNEAVSMVELGFLAVRSVIDMPLDGFNFIKQKP